MEYESSVRVDSRLAPGVQYTVARMSLRRRLELMRHIRELAQKAEFLEAGNSAQERIEASLLAGEIDASYLKWGLVKVEGLTIDGQPATPALLAEAGPEDLCREALAAVKAECCLTEADRKNS